MAVIDLRDPHIQALWAQLGGALGQAGYTFGTDQGRNQLGVRQEAIKQQRLEQLLNIFSQLPAGRTSGFLGENQNLFKRLGQPINSGAAMTAGAAGPYGPGIEPSVQVQDRPNTLGTQLPLQFQQIPPDVRSKYGIQETIPARYKDVFSKDLDLSELVKGQSVYIPSASLLTMATGLKLKPDQMKEISDFITLNPVIDQRTFAQMAQSIRSMESGASKPVIDPIIQREIGDAESLIAKSFDNLKGQSTKGEVNLDQILGLRGVIAAAETKFKRLGQPFPEKYKTDFDDFVSKYAKENRSSIKKAFNIGDYSGKIMFYPATESTKPKPTNKSIDLNSDKNRQRKKLGLPPVP